jgi:hypothetical protein
LHNWFPSVIAGRTTRTGYGAGCGHTSEIINLTMLAGRLQEMQRDERRLRVRRDQLAGTSPARLDCIDARLGVMKKTIHASQPRSLVISGKSS